MGREAGREDWRRAGARSSRRRTSLLWAGILPRLAVALALAGLLWAAILGWAIT